MQHLKDRAIHPSNMTIHCTLSALIRVSRMKCPLLAIFTCILSPSSTVIVALYTAIALDASISSIIEAVVAVAHRDKLCADDMT